MKISDRAVDVLRYVLNMPNRVTVSGRSQARVLLYHKVCDLPPSLLQRHSVTPADFESQMGYLSCNGYRVVLLRDLVASPDISGKSVAITFDDGYMDNYNNALPVLERFGFKATFFVVTDYIGSRRRFPWLDFLWSTSLALYFANHLEDWLPMTADMLRAICNAGHEIGSHSKSHPYLPHTAGTTLVDELVGSRKALEDITGCSVTSFSYPYGGQDERVRKATLEAGYSAAVTTRVAPVSSHSDLLSLGRSAIERSDSPLRFRNKLQGAYDWDALIWRMLHVGYTGS